MTGRTTPTSGICGRRRTTFGFAESLPEEGSVGSRRLTKGGVTKAPAEVSSLGGSFVIASREPTGSAGLQES